MNQKKSSVLPIILLAVAIFAFAVNLIGFLLWNAANEAEEPIEMTRKEIIQSLSRFDEDEMLLQDPFRLIFVGRTVDPDLFDEVFEEVFPNFTARGGTIVVSSVSRNLTARPATEEDLRDFFRESGCNNLFPMSDPPEGFEPPSNVHIDP